MSAEPEVLTVKQAAALLQLSEEAIRENARRGTIPARKIGGWRFLRADLLAMFHEECGIINVVKMPPRRGNGRGRDNGS